MNFTTGFARQILNSNEPNPGTPSRGELFLSFILCKDLADLFETGRAILRETPVHKNLPSETTLLTIQTILNEFYSPDMFIPDNEYGQKPNWSVVLNFNKDNSRAAFQLYKILRRNIISATEMPKALKSRNKEFFLENFDYMFADLPFKDLVSEFKNFIASDDVSLENQEFIWDFIDSLVSLINDDQENIQTIEKL